MFECAAFFVKNQDFIIKSFIDSQEHESCYDIRDDIIHAITYYSVAVYLFLLPFKTLTIMLEAENFQACYVYPMILKALEETKNIVVEFGLPASLAIELCKAVRRRLINSQTGRILSLLYISTPIGRNSTRLCAPDNGLTIHGDVSTPLDENKIIFEFGEKDQQTLSQIRASGILLFKQKSKEARNSFSSYKGVLVDPKTGRKTSHETLNIPPEDDPLSIDEINEAIYRPTESSDIYSLDDSLDPSEIDNDEREEEDSEFIGEPEWVNDSNVEVRNYRSREDIMSDDDSSESNDYNDYSSEYDDDDEFDGEIEFVDKGIICNSFTTIEEIAQRKGLNEEKINILKSEFGRWLTDDINDFSNNPWAELFENTSAEDIYLIFEI